MKRLEVDRERCQGHLRCCTLAPDLFEPDELGYAIVTNEHLADDAVERARIAAAGCPEAAIKLRG